MLDPEGKVAGDFTLLIDQPVKQTIEGNSAQFSFEEPIVSVAIPLEEKKEDNRKIDAPCPFTHVLGIDQGEAGIAYAVFRLADIGQKKPLPVATGTVRIPSIRRLIKSVSKYRRSKQKEQKFSQQFDSTMFNVRENVTGDVCHAIVGLMQRYKAFPVLEYQVKNLESGSKQLSLVYKAVNSHFLYSSVEGQDAKRKQLWFGSGGWTIKGVEVDFQRKADDEEAQTDSGKHKAKKTEVLPLRVYPGFSVDARYTSKTCSVCGNNISELLSNLAKKSAKSREASIEVKDQGKIQIEGKEIQLFERDTTKPKNYYARRNERVPLTEPVKAGKITFGELERKVAVNLRRPPLSKMSKDTTQSRFYCLFSECSMHNKEQHADVNAAINIGRRFFEQVHLSEKANK